VRHHGGLESKTALLGALALIGVGFAWFWGSALIAARAAPSVYEIFVGALSDFLDTLGVGSFATTTALYRLRKTVEDRAVPGTLNVGHTLPTFVQAFIYVAIVRVEMATLAPMIAAAVAGSWLGAGAVSRWPKRRIQIGLGLALMVAAALLLAQQGGLLPRGGDALGLRGGRLAVGIASNFVLGALMTLGIGLYAPCMILVSILGMSPATAFPIMMGSCAFLMPVASVRFISRSAYSPRAALGLAIGGVPAVIVAAFAVRSLPLGVVRVWVAVVVVYTAFTMLRPSARDL
jgi:uncharacterized membrane protein YfcA